MTQYFYFPSFLPLLLPLLFPSPPPPSSLLLPSPSLFLSSFPPLPLLSSFPLPASDGVSISLVSNAMSENTNNIIATASVNELFSNSSLLRMNAVIPESASVCTATVGVVGENGVKVVGDSASRVCVEVRRFNGVKN